MFVLALRLIEHETEQEAFDQLYTRYRGLAFWVAKGYHLSDSDAEDAVQDAFFALAENFSKYFSQKCPNWKSLIVTIVKNKAIDIWRQNQRRAGETFDEAIHSQSKETLPEEFWGGKPPDPVHPAPAGAGPALSAPAPRARVFQPGDGPPHGNELGGGAEAGAARPGTSGTALSRGGTFMISDERLKQAVHEAAEALDRSLPDPEACSYEPSPEFEARMQTLIREMGEKRERKERRRKLAHRAACLAIAVVACGGCFLGSNAQAREGLWGWIRDSFEGSQNYSFQSTPIPSGDLPAYTMDVPEEYHYVADQSIQSAEYAALTYENDAGNILALDYQYETENSSGSLSVFADEEDVQKVTVNGVSADLYVGENEDSTSIIVWMDPETTALLSVTGDLPADELLALAETVRPVK